MIRIGQGVSVSSTSDVFPDDFQEMHSNAWTITKILTPLSCMLLLFQVMRSPHQGSTLCACQYCSSCECVLL